MVIEKGSVETDDAPRKGLKPTPKKTSKKPDQPTKSGRLKSFGGSISRYKFVLIGILIFAVLVTVFVLWRNDQATMTNDEIVIRVSRELQIQGDGNPVILTVDDESKVNQPFLEGAKNGDKVLLYYKAKKSVLFRPDEDKIVRSGTFTPPDAKVFIRQGTTDASRTEDIKHRLEQLDGLDVVSQDQSVNKSFDKTVVVNVTDRYDELAQKMAASLGMSVVRLPRGESVPDADILVIVGNN